ncbi:MAG: ABC transporter permease [Cyclobacteriaceae bacterium]|nr:ABC transporter permease [Cyclobacteriaceae bacterium]
MLRNYLKIAFRSLIKNRTYSLINILGLSVGISVSLIIFLYVSHEYSYDRFHANANNVYRLLCKINYGGQEIQTTAMSVPFGPILKDNNPDVENYVRVLNAERVLIQSDENHINFENRIAFCDTSFFSVFSFPIKQGNYKTLARPSTVIITEASALKYFGSTDVIGKIITYNKSYPLEIVGVAENFPTNSTFQLDFIISFSTLGVIPSEKKAYEHQVASLGSIPTYVLIKNESAVPKVIASIAGFAKTSVDEKYGLEKFVDTHLGNNFKDSSNQQYLFLFMAVALIILALALINYMNLTTARATLRGKEVGVRKVIGAKVGNLAFQFYFESAIMTAIAFALAWILLEFFLPVFLNIIQIQIDKSFLTSTWFLSVVAALFVGCIIIAGSYPSIILSKFKPVEVLKGRASGTSGNTWVRKGLTIAQFTASIALILITLGIQHQLTFLRNQKLGLNKEQVMVISLGEESQVHYVALKNDLRNLSGVKEVAAASMPLYTTGHNAFFAKTPTTQEDVFILDMSIDENFISTLGMEWIEKPDTLAKPGFIVNEAALEKLKITKSDVGIKFNDRTINGIVKNFAYGSLREKIDGMVMSVKADTATSLTKYGYALYLRLDPKANLTSKIAAVQDVFKKYEGKRPLEYYFLDDAFDQLYKSEDRLSTIFSAFTAIAIVIACLGLFGLITFTAETRTKEIGIRKILGASIQNIFMLLSKDFLVLVLVGIAFGLPLAWWYLNDWLQQFSYKVQIPWWFALLAAGSALVLSFVTICSRAIKAAVSNPVDSLRSE